MFRRLAAVGMFWTLRPLVWGFAIAAIAVLGFQWYWLENHPQHQTYGVMPTAPIPQPQVVWNSSNKSHVQYQDIQWYEVRSVIAWGNTELLEPLWVAGAMPKLRHLSLMGATSEQILRLLGLHNPESLVITDFGLSAEAWESIASEPRLRLLQVYGGGWRQDREPVSRKYPPQLETLIYFGSQRPEEDGLSLLKGHPGLQTLHATFRPSPVTAGMTAQDLEVVRSLPRLKTLYLDGGLLNAYDVQKELPNIRVRPSHIDRTRTLFTLLTLAGGLLLTVLVVAQFSAAMAIPMSALAPRYNLPHVVSVALVWLLGCAAQVVVFSKAGVAPNAIVGLVGLPLAFQALTLLALERASPATPGAVQPLYCAPLLFIWLLGLALFAGVQSSEFDWWLGGNRIDLTAILVVLGAASGLWLIWHFHRTQRRFEAAGCQGAPLGPLDVAGWKVWQQSARGPLELTRHGWRPGIWIADLQLARVIAAGYRGDPARRAALWSLASPIGWRVTLILAVFGTLMGFTPVVLAFRDQGVQPWMLGMLVSGGSMLTSMLVLLPLQSLQVRRTFFPRESLLPVSRGAWVRLMLTEVAQRMGLAVGVAFVFGLSAWLIGGRPTLPLAVFTAGLPTLAGLFLLALGLGIWQASYRLGWVFVLSAGGLVFAVSIVGLLNLNEQSSVWIEAFLTSAPLTHTAALACLVAGYLAVRTGIRRWQRWELGRII